MHLNIDDCRKCIEQPDDTHGTEVLRRVPEKCTVEFQDVSFSYDGVHNAVSHLSFQAEAGEKIAIVGENGAGKTTAMKLLAGLYFPTEGKILINGTDAATLKSSERSKLFSAIFQEVYLMPTTVQSNITMHPNEETDTEKLHKALRLAGLSEKISALPDGVQTRLRKDINHEAAVDLSGGEAQKTAIARALYRDAPFVVLDEPTAALDPVSEFEIYRRFNSFTDGKTAVYISHRLSSCRFCDKIVVFEKGRIVQTGTHEALLADENGPYHALWNAQAKYYITG